MTVTPISLPVAYARAQNVTSIFEAKAVVHSIVDSRHDGIGQNIGVEMHEESFQRRRSESAERLVEG